MPDAAITSMFCLVGEQITLKSDDEYDHKSIFTWRFGYHALCVYVCVRVHACVAHVHVCVLAHTRACVRACVCVRVCVYYVCVHVCKVYIHHVNYSEM